MAMKYAMHFPWHVWPAGRNKKLSPVHERVVELGGQTGVYNWIGKEPIGSRIAGDDTSKRPRRHGLDLVLGNLVYGKNAKRSGIASEYWIFPDLPDSTCQEPARPNGYSAGLLGRFPRWGV